MTPQEFNRQIDDRLQQLRANRPREVLIISQELKTAVQLRIQTRGENFLGASFIGYSRSWAKDRKSRGRQTNYVDFTDTGRLWANIQPAILSNTKDQTIVEVTARDRENQDKLRGARSLPRSAPRGNILIPNQKEIGLASEANRRRLLKYLNI